MLPVPTFVNRVNLLTNTEWAPSVKCCLSIEMTVYGKLLDKMERLNHLRLLEAESIHIFREVVAECQRPVLLYSIGKDSSVLLRLAQKAFYPAPIPFPLLHVDTGYKFREMIDFRDRYTAELGAQADCSH